MAKKAKLIIPDFAYRQAKSARHRRMAGEKGGTRESISHRIKK